MTQRRQAALAAARRFFEAEDISGEVDPYPVRGFHVSRLCAGFLLSLQWEDSAPLTTRFDFTAMQLYGHALSRGYRSSSFAGKFL